MKKDELFYTKAVLLHAGLGGLFFFIPFLAKIYGIAIFLWGLGYVIKTQNRNHEVLLLAAYFTGIDVYLKMIGASFLNEYGKYTVIIFMVLGIFYQGFSKSAFLYVFFIALLIPGIYVGVSTLSLDANIRKAIAFNITGPVCLGISALYCFRRVISINRLKDVLAMLLFPLVAMVIHLFLYTPNIQEVVTNTQSNYGTSGGFGPNQVSTVLGLAMFAAFARFLLASSSLTMKLINGFLIMVFAYRCIITFSRGGMYTGLAMMLVLMGVMYLIMDIKNKVKIVLMGGLGVLAGLMIWSYSSLQTGGMIDKRYANQNAAGIEKESQLTGRETLMETELQMFLENPLLGVGVGRNKEVRMEETGIEAATHSEITRMLAEHGSLGLLGLLILFFTPIVVYLRDRTQIFAIVFMVFWLLTINHAAMRIAAPAFIYALALLNIKFINENNPAALHRE